MYRLIFIFIFISSAFSLEIDIKYLEKNLYKNDIENRLVISKYYLYNNDLNKSKKYILEVLKMDPQNKEAKKFLKLINLKSQFITYLKNNNTSLKRINEFYKNLYLNHKYKEIINNAKFIKFFNSDYPKLITSKVLMLNGNYQESKDILELVKNKNSLDYIEIKAHTCYYLKDYKCAKDNFSTLYFSTYKLNYAYKLLDTYFLLNDINKANKLISNLLKKYPNVSKIKEYKEKFLKLKESQLNKLKNIYQKNNKFSDLQKIVHILLISKQNDEAYRLLNDYISKHPNDDNAKYWYATYLSWNNQNNEALYILNSIKDKSNYKAKLLKAKILAWGGEYKKALNYLNDIIYNSNDNKLIIDAKELKGFIYYWQQNYKKAKPLLQEVSKYKLSIEIEEALMNIEGNVKPLIKKYIRLYNKDKNNLEYILKIAQFSERIKDINRAIKFYEKAYKINPNKLEIAHSLARLYLLKNNPYKAFSYYEYWAYKVHSEASLLELAHTYYYSGYNQSALEVIKDILKRYPNSQKAMDLKAKILKIEPKFIQNNSKITILDVLNNKSKQLLKLANKLYFNAYYTESTDYFKTYLLENANDYEARERYAYALQFIGKYKKASGEFFLVTRKKKSCDIFYHYGISLEKSGKKEKAKKAYQIAKEYAIKPLSTNAKLEKFINNWKKAIESLDINKYKKFYSKKIINNKLWLDKKEKFFKGIKFISLYFKSKSIIFQKKYKKFTIYKVKLYEQYTTDKQTNSGYKILTIKCYKNRCFIEDEKWKKDKFILPNYGCYNTITHLGEFKNSKKTITMRDLIKSMKDFKNDNDEISLDKALKKDVGDEKEVLATFDVNVSNKFILPKKKKQNKNNFLNLNLNKNYKFGILGHYYKENKNLTLLQNGVYYKDNLLYVDFQKWKLSQNKNNRNGKLVTIKVKKGAFTFGGEIGNYEKFNYIYPYLAYKNDFEYKLYKNVVGREKESFCAIDKNLSSINFSISKYKGANISQKDITNYWFDVTFSKISDDNVAITPQFEYRFNKQNSSTNNLNMYYYLSGWYVSDSKENSCYYSPNFYDSTFFELHPTYKNLELIGKIGYSFKENASLYGYGFDFQYNDYLKLNCMKNYSYRKSDPEYSYFECYLNAGVTW